MDPQTKDATATKMPTKKDATKRLEDVFEDSLKDIYWAEKALIKALPKMGKNACSAKLKKTIGTHFAQTVEQVFRLEYCFKSIDKKIAPKKCEVMEGLLREAEGIIDDTEPGAVRDAGIIAATQKIAHYEIATYGFLAAFAKILNQKVALKILLKTLDEQKKCDAMLSAITAAPKNTKTLFN